MLGDFVDRVKLQFGVVPKPPKLAGYTQPSFLKLMGFKQPVPLSAVDQDTFNRKVAAHKEAHDAIIESYSRANTPRAQRAAFRAAKESVTELRAEIDSTVGCAAFDIPCHTRKLVGSALMIILVGVVLYAFLFRLPSR